MMIGLHDPLAILMRLAFFGLLVQQIVQLIKTYLVPVLKEQLAFAQKQRKEMVHSVESLGLSLARKEHDLARQSQMLAGLDAKIIAWHAHLAQEQKKQQYALLEMSRLAAERNARIQEYRAQSALLEQQLPAIMTHAEELLVKKFAADACQSSLKAMIQKLPRLASLPSTGDVRP